MRYYGASSHLSCCRKILVRSLVGCFVRTSTVEQRHMLSPFLFVLVSVFEHVNNILTKNETLAWSRMTDVGIFTSFFPNNRAPHHPSRIFIARRRRKKEKNSSRHIIIGTWWPRELQIATLFLFLFFSLSTLIKRTLCGKSITNESVYFVFLTRKESSQDEYEDSNDSVVGRYLGELNNEYLCQDFGTLCLWRICRHFRLSHYSSSRLGQSTHATLWPNEPW